MKAKDYSYFIERYNSGDMTETEKQWFIREMENNRELVREIEFRRRTDEILQKKDSMQLRSKLAFIESQRKENIRKAAERRMTVAKYAAVFAGAAIITSMILFTGRSLTSEEIINQFYNSYDAPAAHRSSSSLTASSEYLLGLKYYNEKDYKNAASQFAKVLEKNPDDMQTYLLSGVSNMEVKKFNEAKKSFTTVIEDNNNLFIESAKWYLALCYIKTEDNTKAKDILMSIKKEGGVYSKDARKILRRIN